jgi:hypothetical protein
MPSIRGFRQADFFQQLGALLRVMGLNNCPAENDAAHKSGPV